jgi:hypothetical protein
LLKAVAEIVVKSRSDNAPREQLRSVATQVLCFIGISFDVEPSAKEKIIKGRDFD